MVENPLANTRTYRWAALAGTGVSLVLYLVMIAFAVGVAAPEQARLQGAALLLVANVVAYVLGRNGVQRLPGVRGVIGFLILSLLFPWFILPVMCLSLF